MRFLILLVALLSLAITALLIEAVAIKKYNSVGSISSARRNHLHAFDTYDERFKSCGDPSKDIFQFKSIKSDRYLCSGCGACIDVEGLLKGKIDKGSKLQLEVFFFIFKVYDKTFDLCDLLDSVKDGPKCPIAPSAQGLKACLPLDGSITTDVAANIKLTVTDALNNQVLCIGGSAMIASRCPAGFGPGSTNCIVSRRS